MACHFSENVYTTVFTPREYQVELLDTSKESNTIVCLGNNNAKVFVAVKLLQELAADVRRPNGTRSVFLLDIQNVNIMSSHIRNLTDLTVSQYENIDEVEQYTSEIWKQEVRSHQVLVMTSDICLLCMKSGYLTLKDINLLVIDDCRIALKQNSLRQILKEYTTLASEGRSRPRILGLTTTALCQNFDPARLKAEFEYMEKILNCTVDTSSDIVTVLRYCSKPYEKLMLCANAVPCTLNEKLECFIENAKLYLRDHRYDPYEIYEEEFHEELQEVPDPKSEPMAILDEFLYVLNTMGAWCADRAAFALLIKIENLKVKTPYERHYLLLCMVSTVMVKIRAVCNDEFEKLGNDSESIYAYSSPRVLRLLQVLRTFKPDIPKKSVEATDSPTTPTLNSIGTVPIPAEPTDNAASNEQVAQIQTPTTAAATTTTEDVINANGCDSSENHQNNGCQDSSITVNSVMSVVRPWKNRVMRGHRKGGANSRPRASHITDPDALCAVVFVEKRFTAKILYYLINELCHCQEDFSFLSVQYTVEKIADPVADNREAEIEHRKQEDVLKKFRMHECNLLIATSVLEEGIDIPKCNLVVRFDQPMTYNSYVQCKGRAKMPEAHYVLMCEEQKFDHFLHQVAQYIEIEKMLLEKCKNREASDLEEREADLYTKYIQPYSPPNSPTGASVSVTTAIALVNKYCAKLPSDTFTRLTPLWWMKNNMIDNQTVMYVCSIRLPINSPLKQTITGVAMPNRVLARRVAALQVCRLLHQMGELDDNLMPVGKESFKAFEDDWNNFPLEESDELITKNNLEPRPGTTKRRQYYYKRVADALTDCRPLASVPAYLYLITMKLTCPLPEEQNTRGRKIYPPEDSAQGFGILTLKQIPKICPFPIFTRSGEVQVGLELASSEIIMTSEQLEKIMEFLNYVFTNVLRLQKYHMLFDPNASENSYFIVPTITVQGTTNVDWNFLNEIYENRNLTPCIIPEEDRKDFSFNPEMYQDAVVMPWYRNQDQPQYFYVAEICNHLNPKSSFPGTDYKTFEEYYFKKYGIQIQNLDQPLLDVDHTSARLNFLTPRYVNRKGVALPTSSEETKRAKRENLEQKQILVPELCTVHPFPASLWRKAVCLPCILYRINALLLADQIRKQVAEDLALGLVELSSEFEWPSLNFGWSLSDVLKKSKENRQDKIVEKSPERVKRNEICENLDELEIVEIVDDEQETIKNNKLDENIAGQEHEQDDKKLNGNSEESKRENNEEIEDENDDEHEQDKDKDWMEIGTWSNEMATSCKFDSESLDSLMSDLPKNVTMCYNRDGTWNNNKMGGVVRYGSPTSWMQSAYYDDYDSDDSCDSYSSEPESSDNSNRSGGLRIEFKSDNVAEAIDIESGCANRTLMLMAPDHSDIPECIDDALEATVQEHVVSFNNAVEQNEKHIKSSDVIISIGNDFQIEKKIEESKATNEQYKSLIESLKLPVVDHDSNYIEQANQLQQEDDDSVLSCRMNNNVDNPDFEKINFKFSFDYQPNLTNHPGPSPSVILQALTMSNANDGINLERLETIGDSFLKYAITNYLYSTYDNIHEGKLSHLRSKQVSNLNLYRLGRLKILGESMIATKFDPHDNWLPPCYYVPKELEQALIDARVPASHWNRADLPTVKEMSKDEICQMVREKGEKLGVLLNNRNEEDGCEIVECKTPEVFNLESMPCFIPYNLITQHSIPDKSVADCVEALIGAYLIECGPRGALLFMAWLGIRVLPKTQIQLADDDKTDRPTGSLPPEQQTDEENCYKQVLYGELTCPRSPLLHHCADPHAELEKLLDGYDEFEYSIQYYFRDRSYLLQALTHASYSPNTVTDCYQRLEFLGDAVLDYLITRHLYEDPRLHSPGALTDLRSALVNNTIFASLAVRHGFHKYFRHLSPGLQDVVNRFVQIQEENGHSISEEYYLIAEDESEEIEDVEVPKALGDVFESVAGAIFLDSGMSLDAVWRVYYRMMRNEIEQFSTSVPKSPIRELLELEPETAKFGKPEKLADGRRVRVTVEVFGKGTFKGIGRNYRIAKCTAAKCALKQLKKRGLLVRKN